jgi:hypothetical protein
MDIKGKLKNKLIPKNCGMWDVGSEMTCGCGRICRRNIPPHGHKKDVGK